MRIGITGHTGLVGAKIFENFKNSKHELIGLSRSTGYDLKEDYSKCINILKTCNLVFNNAYVDTVQADIIKDLKDTSAIVVTSGSIGAYYDFSQYCLDKKLIHSVFEVYKKFYDNRCLLLIMGFLKNNEHGFAPIDINSVIESINFFLQNTRITKIEYANIDL
jgi:hypothetical protein